MVINTKEINMIGSIVGDIIGSVYEFHNQKRKDIELDTPNMRFTDDTILTVATMDALLHPEIGYAKMYKKYFRKYVNSRRGFGGYFYDWGLSDSLKPYNSFGNGSAMRVSPVAYVAQSIDEILLLAKQSAEVTHNHPAGIEGAQAIALAIFMALNNYSKDKIKQEIKRLEQISQDKGEKIRELEEALHLAKQQQADKDKEAQQAQNNSPVSFSAGQASWRRQPSFSCHSEDLENGALTAIIRYTVDKQRNPTSVTLAKSTGNVRVDRQLSMQAKSGKFNPFTKNGVPVVGIVNLPVRCQ